MRAFFASRKPLAMLVVPETFNVVRKEPPKMIR